MRYIALCLALCGPIATEIAQAAPASENWTPTSRNAQTITGRVTFTPTQISFQNGTSLPLVPGGQMLFRPEPKKKKVMADLYKVASPDDPVLENGNRLCKGKPVSYLIVWKSETIGHEADPRTLAPFCGKNLNAGSLDDCGRFVYDARIG
jgi:hypothetical protein